MSSSQRQKNRDVNRQRIAPVAAAFAEALSTITGIDNCDEDDTFKVLNKAEKEASECKRAVENIYEMTKDIDRNYLPKIENNQKEMERLFSAIDAMEDSVIPALNEDLTTIELLITELEKQQASAHPSTLTTWLSYFSSSNSRAAEKISIPNCILHDPSKLLGAVQKAASAKEDLEAATGGDPL